MGTSISKNQNISVVAFAILCGTIIIYDVSDRGVADTISILSVMLWFVATVATIAFNRLSAQRDILNPLAHFTDLMKKYAENNVSTPVQYLERSDAIGELARSFLTFKKNCESWQTSDADIAANNLRAAEERRRADETLIANEREIVINSFGLGLSRLAANDLSFRLTADLPGNYNKLRDDFNNAVEQIENLVSSVQTAVASVRNGSQEISSAAEDLSRRTEQQAASLEEAVAALSEISQTVNKSTEQAQQARVIVSAAHQDADQSRDVVTNAVSAMGKISASSSEISQIIGVIDEIAFQTNLLALNAGVEAARAGEAGRGFAVVASEVRSLAQRSADAAKKIKDLINNSASQVSDGVQLVAATGDSLLRIAGSITKIDGLVSEFVQRSQEQATGLREVSSATSQIDQATQQNAAISEETTAASRSLANEGEILESLISRFKLSGSRRTENEMRTELKKVAPHAFGKAPKYSLANSNKMPASKTKKANIVAASFANKPVKGAASGANDSDWTEF